MLTDVRVWVLLDVEYVGELMVAELALKKGDELMGLALIAVEGGAAKVEFEKRILFLGSRVLH